MRESLEKFEALDPSRQQAVLDAALEAFAENGYKDASTENIARAAGISKGLLFFYFRNKRELYFYLFAKVSKKLTDLVIDDEYRRIDDFFELMDYAAGCKARALASMPHLTEFCVRAFYPAHRDVKETMDFYNQQSIDAMVDALMPHVRWDKFRDDVNPRDILNMLIWMTDGYLHQQRCLGARIDIEALVSHFKTWCEMLRQVSYKSEYLPNPPDESRAKQSDEDGRDPTP